MPLWCYGCIAIDSRLNQGSATTASVLCMYVFGCLQNPCIRFRRWVYPLQIHLSPVITKVRGRLSPSNFLLIIASLRTNVSTGLTQFFLSLNFIFIIGRRSAMVKLRVNYSAATWKVPPGECHVDTVTTSADSSVPNITLPLWHTHPDTDSDSEYLTQFTSLELLSLTLGSTAVSR